MATHTLLVGPATITDPADLPDGGLGITAAGALWWRPLPAGLDRADPVQVGGPGFTGGGSGVFATDTEYGILYAAKVGWDGGFGFTTAEVGPWADVPPGYTVWEDIGGGIAQRSVPPGAVHVTVTTWGVGSTCRATIEDGYVRVQPDFPGDAGDFFIQVCGTLDA